MSNLLTVIQQIAVNAVQSTNPMEYRIGTVTSADPLKIRLNDSTLEISGSSILLTEPVVEKKITIQKHTHKIGATIASHTHIVTPTDLTVIAAPAPTTPPGPSVSGVVPATNDFNKDTTIIDTVLDAKCTEFGVDLPIKSDSNKIVFTTNRALEKDDKVLMLKVSDGQQFIVLSRIFRRDDEIEGV